MTDDRLALLEALQKADDGNFLRSLAETVLQILMEADVEGMIGAGRYERSGERTTWRNGYRERTLDTRLGPLNLKIPKLRTGSYFPPFLEARKTAERALVAVIQEAWIAGVSTRKVDDLVQAMGLSGISKSQVSKLCKEIDERVHAFLKRPLSGEWPYLWLDATYLKVREGGRIVSVAGHNRRGGQHRRQARDRRAAYRPLRGRALLDDLPARPGATGPQGREARDLGCP
jgi:transposase-like protein